MPMNRKLLAILLVIIAIVGTSGVIAYQTIGNNNPNKNTPSLSPSPTMSPTLSPTATPTATPTLTPTPTVTPTPTPTSTTPSQITVNANKYLISVYNSTLNLIPETATNNVYYITSDNLLAYFALQDYSSDVSNSIKNTIADYASTYGLPKDSNGLPIDYKHETVLGDSLISSLRTTNTYSIVNGSGTIMAEVNNGSGVMSDWQNYSDLVAYMGLSYYNQGNIQGAINEYNTMMSMWNGHGFVDNTNVNATVKTYDTYKLALAIILAKDCGIPTNAEMISIISNMQDGNGGIHTQYTYDTNLTVVGSVNTETTALVAIADPTP